MSTNPTTQGMSEAEVLAVLDVLEGRLGDYDCDNEIASKIASARSTIEHLYAELARAKDELHAQCITTQWHADRADRAEAELGRMRNEMLTAAAQFHAEEDRANAADDAKCELIAMMRRLMPYARLEAERHAERGGDGGETESVIDAAESLLARLAGPTDQSTEQRG
jgi:hypothetical protein